MITSLWGPVLMRPGFYGSDFKWRRLCPFQRGTREKKATHGCPHCSWGNVVTTSHLLKFTELLLLI